MKEFFDAYGIRVRLSSLLILLGPVIFWIVLFVDETRTLPGMVVISAIVLASSAVLVIPMRIKSNEVRDAIFPELPTVTLLSQKNNLIDEATRQRYCKKIQERTTIDLSEPNKKENFKSAIEWLKANYQTSYRNHLVNEENINFGLLCNLLGVKKYGISINIIVIISTIVHYFCTSCDELTTHIVALCVALVFFFIWVCIVTPKNIKYSAEKYATALLSCLDSLNKA